MNLVDESLNVKKDESPKKAARIILAIIVILFILLIALIICIAILKKQELKIYLNDVSNIKLKEVLIFQDDGKIYIPIKAMATYLGYESYNGDYDNKSEEASKCYVQSEKEVANFVLNSDKIYKLNLTKNSNYDYVYIDEPVRAINGNLCTTPDGIEKAFNISFSYDDASRTVRIYTMDYLISYYSKAILNYGYVEISDDFDNQKAILNNMLIVKKDTSKNLYGVIEASSGNVILEPKYNKITYIPMTGDFLVANEKNKLGIMSKTKETKIDISYDNIELIDSDSNLYIVKKENKYGVVDVTGKTKIYIEYDQIGIDNTKFEKNEIKNKYLLLDKLIPVRKDKLWGLYDKNGNQVVECMYDSFGYIASNNKEAQNLLIIPNYDLIVICKDKKYGLINTSGIEVIRPQTDDIYMTISAGNKNYYINYNNQTTDAIKFLDSIGIKNNINTENTTNTLNTTNTTNTSNMGNIINETNIENNSYINVEITQ